MPAARETAVIPEAGSGGMVPMEIEEEILPVLHALVDNPFEVIISNYCHSKAAQFPIQIIPEEYDGVAGTFHSQGLPAQIVFRNGAISFDSSLPIEEKDIGVKEGLVRGRYGEQSLTVHIKVHIFWRKKGETDGEFCSIENEFESPVRQEKKAESARAQARKMSYVLNLDDFE